MMGGLVFMLNDKMCCGIHFDKKRNCDILMARVGVEATQAYWHAMDVIPWNLPEDPWKAMSLSTPMVSI